MEVAINVMDLGHLKLRRVPKYSSDLIDAMQVVDRMRKLGHRWMIVFGEEGYFLRHLVNVTHDLERDEKRYTADRPMGGPLVPQTAAQLARAICIAALDEIKLAREA